MRLAVFAPIDGASSTGASMVSRGRAPCGAGAVAFATGAVFACGAGFALGAGAGFGAATFFGLAERGGAPLLGLAGVAIVGHGRSSAQAVENGIATAARLVEQRIVPRLAEALVA